VVVGDLKQRAYISPDILSVVYHKYCAVTSIQEILFELGTNLLPTEEILQTI
jgi:hypothetical protein